MKNPFLSVVIPVYNGEEYLREAVATVCGQPCKDLEIILCNDGSTDGTGALCQQLMAEDARIRYLEKENSGVSDTRNRGISEAQGTYVAFMDADDGWTAGVYTDAVREKILEAEMPDMVSFGLTWCGTTLQNIENSHVPEEACVCQNDALNVCWGTHCAAFYRRELLLNPALQYPNTHAYFEDLIFKVRITYAANRVLVLPYALYMIRNNSSSVMHVSRDKIFRTQHHNAITIVLNQLAEMQIQNGWDSYLCDRIVQLIIRDLKLSSAIFTYGAWKREVLNRPICAEIKAGFASGELSPNSICASAFRHPFVFYLRNRLPMRARTAYRWLRSRLWRRK